MRKIIQNAALVAHFTIINRFKINLLCSQHIVINLEVFVCASISTVVKRFEATLYLKLQLLNCGFDGVASIEVNKSDDSFVLLLVGIQVRSQASFGHPSEALSLKQPAYYGCMIR